MTRGRVTVPNRLRASANAPAAKTDRQTATTRPALMCSSVAMRTLAMSFGLILGLVAIEGMLRLGGLVREVGPALTRYDPVYGKRLRENIQATRTSPEFRIRYSVNALGYRGPQPEKFPEHPILFLGDSFTEGYGVSDGEEFPELIRRALVESHGRRAPPVVNAGIGNTGNGHWVKWLRLEGRRFAPRLVVLQFTSNDAADNLREQMYGLDSNGQLIERPVAQRGPVHKINELVAAVPGLSSSHLVGFGYQLYHRYNDWHMTRVHVPGGVETAADNDLTLRLWEEALRICHEAGWPVVGIAVEFAGPHLVQLRGILERYDARLIVAPTKEQRPDLYYEIDGHWNPLGHAFVAQMLQRELNGMIFR